MIGGDRSEDRRSPLLNKLWKNNCTLFLGSFEVPLDFSSSFSSGRFSHAMSGLYLVCDEVEKQLPLNSWLEKLVKLEVLDRNASRYCPEASDAQSFRLKKTPESGLDVVQCTDRSMTEHSLMQSPRAPQIGSPNLEHF